jgi:hypothetical protein
MPQRFAAILFCLIFQGCVIIDTAVTNPIPGMSRVAVVPFRNLTSHPNNVVDGRRFAMAYSSELQKVPGFEIVPVGVVEVAMLDTGLKLSNPDELQKLAELLGVDVFVDGEISEYDPFYPPRIGLNVQWISPYAQMFSPGVQIAPSARRRLKAAVENEENRLESLSKPLRSPHRQQFRLPTTIRGQSIDRIEDWTNTGVQSSLGNWQGRGTIGDPSLRNWQQDDRLTADRSHTLLPPNRAPARPLSATATSPDGLSSLSPALFGQTPLPGGSTLLTDPAGGLPYPAAASGGTDPKIQGPPIPPLPGDLRNPSESDTMRPMLKFPSKGADQSSAAAQLMWSPASSPVQPLMSYARVFDGSDSELVAELRDYVELNADMRGGEWEAYLQRSDDFIRFVCHRMIKEMLTLHGGEGRRRIVLKFRKFK